MPRQRYIVSTAGATVLDYYADSDAEAVASLPRRLRESGDTISPDDVALCAAYDGVTMPIWTRTSVRPPVFNLLGTKLEADGSFHVWCSGEEGDDFELAMDMGARTIEVVAWSTLTCVPDEVPTMVAMDPRTLPSDAALAVQQWAARDYGVQAQYDDALAEERLAMAEE